MKTTQALTILALVLTVAALVLLALGLNQPAPSSGPLTIGTPRPVSSAPALEIRGKLTPVFDIATGGKAIHLYRADAYTVTNGAQTVVITGPLEIQLEKPLDVPIPVYQKGK